MQLVARSVLQDWNSGKIPFYTLPPARQRPLESSIVSSFAKEINIDELQAGDSATLSGLRGATEFGDGAIVMVKPKRNLLAPVCENTNLTLTLYSKWMMMT